MPHSNFLYKLLEFVIRDVTRKNNDILIIMSIRIEYILISAQFWVSKFFFIKDFNKMFQCSQCRESPGSQFLLGTHVLKIMCNIHSRRVNLIQTTRISLFFNLSLLRIFYNVSLDQAYFLTYLNKRTKKRQISLGTHFECCFANNIILVCHYISQVMTEHFWSFKNELQFLANKQVIVF